MPLFVPALDKDAVMRLGTIKKLVRVASCSSREADLGSEGYGIIHGQDGRDIYFVHTAVHGCRFDELVSGQAVQYSVEEGPLGRAATVVPLNPS